MEVLQQAIADLTPGCYIVAVSGGVDSMVLLDMLRRRNGLRLVVAHVNHGMRDDADLDEELVKAFCASHNIQHCAAKLHLGPQTSEAKARKARYAFLRQCRIKNNALAILTAHHQDDLIETALLNMLRGTDWRGLAPFSNQTDILRPLLDVPKVKLINYAKRNDLAWREDTTNTQTKYLRNYVRHVIMPFLANQNNDWRSNFLRHIRKQQTIRRKIEAELNNALTLLTNSQNKKTVGRRYEWIMLPESLRYEYFQALCRTHLGNSLVKSLAKNACLFIKTALPGKTMQLNKDWLLRVTRHDFVVEPSPGMVK